MGNAQWGSGFHKGKKEGAALFCDQMTDAESQERIAEIDWLIENIAMLMTVTPEDCERVAIPRTIEKLIAYQDTLKAKTDVETAAISQ